MSFYVTLPDAFFVVFVTFQTRCFRGFKGFHVLPNDVQLFLHFLNVNFAIGRLFACALQFNLKFQFSSVLPTDLHFCYRPSTLFHYSHGTFSYSFFLRLNLLSDHDFSPFMASFASHDIHPQRLKHGFLGMEGRLLRPQDPVTWLLFISGL